MSATLAAPITCDVPVFYATSEGQTRRIAERLAGTLHDHGLDSIAIDVSSSGAGDVDWTRVRGALVGASLHMARHQRAAADFVHAHAAALSEVPSAFFSVSLSAASRKPEEAAAAGRIAAAFPRDHGWTPAFVVALAGRLAYTKYGFFKRWLMKRIARAEGAPTDASRDYELTDWSQVELLARDVAALVHAERRGVGLLRRAG